MSVDAAWSLVSIGPVASIFPCCGAAGGVTVKGRKAGRGWPERCWTTDMSAALGRGRSCCGFDGVVDDAAAMVDEEGSMMSAAVWIAPFAFLNELRETGVKGYTVHRV